MKAKKSIFILSFLFVCISNAQTNDMQLWLNAGARKLVNNKTSLDINFGTRFAENLTWRNYQFAQIGFKRKLLPLLSFALSGRVYQSEELEYSRYKFRLMIDIKLNKKLEFIAFNFRTRYQIDRSLVDNYESAFIPVHKWRNRFELEFLPNQLLRPFVSGEVWYDFRPMFRTFNNLRLRSGLSYKMDKHHTYAIAFIYDKPLNRYNIYTNSYVINCSYQLTF